MDKYHYRQYNPNLNEFIKSGFIRDDDSHYGEELLCTIDNVERIIGDAIKKAMLTVKDVGAKKDETGKEEEIRVKKELRVWLNFAETLNKSVGSTFDEEEFRRTSVAIEIANLLLDKNITELNKERARKLVNDLRTKYSLE